MQGLLGEIAQQQQQQFQDTLDEPVIVTIRREFVSVFSKFAHVLRPHKSRALLHDWDLWGPLVLTMTLALLLRSSAQSGQESQVFSGVFVIIWFGATVVTINNQLLGGTLSFFQGLTVLGYCMTPLVSASVLLRLLSFVINHVWIRVVLVAVGFAWAVYASMGFLSDSGPPGRRALIVYPTILFYVVLGWLIINDAHGSTASSEIPRLIVHSNISSTITSTTATTGV